MMTVVTIEGGLFHRFICICGLSRLALPEVDCPDLGYGRSNSDMQIGNGWLKK